MITPNTDPLTDVSSPAMTFSEVSQTVDNVIRRGGSFRDLLADFSIHTGRVLTGSVFRDLLDAYDLRQTLIDLFQSPGVIEAIDEVTVSSQNGKPGINFHFPQPQLIKQRTGLGTIQIQINETVTFRVDAEGDIVLNPGDVNLRWMMLHEHLLIHTRRFVAADGLPQDFIHISAGNIISRQIPLAQLGPPDIIRQPVLTIPDETPSPLPDQDALLVVRHYVPGRVRFQVEGLYRNRDLKLTIEQTLTLQSGIIRGTVNILTGTVLVIFEHSFSLAEIKQQVYQAVLGLYLDTAQPDQEPWHLLPEADVIDYWESCPKNGLSPIVVQERQATYGPNLLPQPHGRSKFEILSEQFTNLPVALLAGSAVLSVLTGGIADAVIIMGVVTLNGIIGYVTERQAERTIADLTRGVRPNGTVIRNGCELEILGEELVPGDILVLKRGMYIPADARLFDVERLTVDESALTGESVPVAKQTDTPNGQNVPLSNRTNLVYRGTIVTGGSGRAIVVATGSSTEVGLVQRLVTDARPPETPLQRQLHLLGVQLAILSSLICGGVFAIGLLRGRNFLQMLKISVSLAVAAVPEGLPTVSTTTLALGVRRLKADNVYIRRLSALEALGALQEVCLDKTGTITLNQMKVVSIFADMALYDLEDGKITQQGTPVPVSTIPELSQLLRLTALCTEIELDTNVDLDDIQGSPTETALIQAAMQLDIDVSALRQAYPLLHKRLRSDQRSFMETLHQASEIGLPDHPTERESWLQSLHIPFIHPRQEKEAADTLIVIKGQPAQVLSMCGWQMRAGAVVDLTAEDRVRIETENERMAGRALRVLGVAYAVGDVVSEQEGNLIWVGLVGIADPPRVEMPALIAQFHQAGIHTTMITGDQSATAQAVAKAIGLSRNGNLEILDSAHLDELEPDLLRALAQRVDVFSRVSPAHKLKIVQALQKSGHVVAMTGDGINDGPALRAANIGIAMGREDTEVAQEIADIVISDESLERIITAIEQGRTIHDDIKKAVHFILSSNTSEILTMLVATTLGLPEPLNPMQLLWINLVTDVFPELALAIQPPEADVLNRPPHNPNDPMFTRDNLQQIGLEGAILTSGAMATYGWGLMRYGIGSKASTLAFMTLTASQLLHTLSCRSETNSLFDPDPIPTNTYIPVAVGGGLALQGLASITPGLRSILRTSPLGMLDWAVTIGMATAPLVANEMIKAIKKNRIKPRLEQG